MIPIDNKLVARALELYREAADGAEYNAGMCGEHHDGGASRMRNVADAFTDGWNKVECPAWLEKHYKGATAEANEAEFAEYERLKAKYEKP